VRLPALVIACSAALGAASPAAAAADDRPAPVVSILTTAYGSARTEVLSGDTVSWRNDSVQPHTVSASDGSWASDRLGPRATFSHRFEGDGTVDYFCQIHPGMRAQVDVRRLLLTAPRDAAAPGRPFELTGRAALPAGSTVAIEDEGGSSVATTTVDAAGAFRATVTPSTTTAYRAVAGEHSSQAVQVLVLDRRVEATGHRRGPRVVIGTRVLPASPGARVVLQLHLRERFGWWPVRRMRLDDASRARFTLRRGRPVRARVVLVASDGATPLAVSASFRVR
jgi:plastocyanin